MKIRSGFVSNSSSSSFVICSTSKKKDLEITVKINISDYIEEVITNKKELDQWFEDWYGYAIDDPDVTEYEKEDYEKYLTEILEGGTIYIGSCGNENYDGAEEFLQANGLSRNVVQRNFDVIKEMMM